MSKTLNVDKLKGYPYTDGGKLNVVGGEGGGANLDEFIAGEVTSVKTDLEIIPDFAFSAKSGLQNVEAQNATFIGKYAFSSAAASAGQSGSGSSDADGEGSDEGEDDLIFNNNALQSIAMDHVTHISKGAFEGDKNLVINSLPDTVLVIEENAFKDCPNVQLGAFPANVVYIGDYAFPEQTNMDLNTLPESLTYIGQGIFNGDSVISYINSLASYDDSVLDVSNIPTAWFDIWGYYQRDLPVINNITHATSIIFPEVVTSIGVNAFNGCEALTSLTIPEGVTSIGVHAFFGCHSLTSLDLPESLTSIGIFAFSECNYLTSLTIPEGVTSIGKHAFDECYSLTSLTIPEGINSIGERAFYNCDALTDIYYSGTEEQWNSIEGISNAGFKGTETIHFEYTS